MNTQIGFSVPESLGVRMVPALELAVETDCNFIEFVMDGNGHPDRLPDDFSARLADTDLGLVVHLPFSVPVAAPFAAQHEGLVATHEHCLDIAASLGAEKAVLHPSSAAWKLAWPNSEIETNIAESVRELHAYGADKGIEVCVENLITSRFTVENFDQLLKATDAPMTLDTGHARAVGFDSDEIAAFAADHRERISHIHLNDTLGESDDHLPFGAGTIDFDALFRALGDDWEGTLCLEVVVGDLEYVGMSVRRLREIL